MNPQTPAADRPAGPVVPTAAKPDRSATPPGRKGWIAVLIAGAATVAWMAYQHYAAHAPSAAAENVSTVAVAPIARRDLFRELTIQAEFRPYLEVELHAKVAGYLKSINVDFGDRVKAGDVIASIEVPELHDQLDHAIAAEQRAEADYKYAHLDYTRLSDVNKSQPNLVAQQDLDAAQARDDAMAATLAGAKADVERYRTLFNYTRIIAPFDGVVTARYADPGAMIQAGSSSPTLIRLSQNQRLRLDFPVSVSYAQYIKPGDSVEILLDGSSRPLTAPISRSSRRISSSTRTMDTEVEVPNSDLKLIPGMYATVVLHLEKRLNALALPVEAVSGAGAPMVYRVNSGGELEERPVKLGIESPQYYEILSGLEAGDLVVIGSKSGLQPGQKVLTKTIAAVDPSHE
jgi:RND family efflux transporter MFP subunit